MRKYMTLILCYANMLPYIVRVILLKKKYEKLFNEKNK